MSFSNTGRLTFAGDWGTGPGFTIAGWLAAGMRRRLPEIAWPVVATTPGAMDCLRAVAVGECDAAMTLPECNVEMARRGVGAFSAAFPDLRVLGRLPHSTLLTFVAGSGVVGDTIADVLSSQPVRVATRIEAFGSMSAVVGRIVHHYRSLGARLDIVETSPAYGSSAALVEDRADVILHQASIEIWQELAQKADVRFMSFDEDLVAGLESAFGCTRRTVPAGLLPSVDGEDVLGLDWSDFFVVAQASLPDLIATRLAETIVDDAHVLEGLMFREDGYSHLTSRIDPAAVARTDVVPVHEAALAFYRSRDMVPE